MSIETQFISYNYKISVKYSNNLEYRKCFRQVFKLDTEQILLNLKLKYPDFDTFEDETKDELLYDEPKINKTIDEILTMTIFTELFKEFYKKAASFVISDLPDIGLTILLSYDYFQEFHIVLSEWFEFLESHNWDIKKVQKSEELDNFFNTSISIKKFREHLFH